MSAAGKPKTRAPYVISFTPYTTPTPLPKRPDWKPKDWLEYFKTNHPNFWFQEQMRKKILAKLNGTLPKPQWQKESEFDYENWKSWTPETWIKWANSKEYKDKYLNVLNPYKVQEGIAPDFKVYEDLDGPVLNFKESQSVYIAENEYNRLVEEQKNLDEFKESLEYKDYEDVDESIIEAKKGDTEKDDLLPAETFLPKPTASPTKDPYYYRTKSQYITRKGPIGGISEEYIYKNKASKKSRQDSRIPENYDLRYRQKSPIDIDSARLKDRQIPAGAVEAVNPEDFLLKTSDTDNRQSQQESLDFVSNNSGPNTEFTIPYSNYIKNLIDRSGQPILAPLSNEVGQNPDNRQGSRPQPEIVTIGGVKAYDYLAPNRQSDRQNNRPQQDYGSFNDQSFGNQNPPQAIQQQQQFAPQGSSSSSTSHSPSGFSSSAAAASGAGASTSTSSKSGLPQTIEETPNDNQYYPCLDNNCDPESAFDAFEEDYQNEDETLLEELFGDETNTPQSSPVLIQDEEPSDALIIDVGNRFQQSTPPPVFKECTSIEECLGTSQAQSASSNQEGWLTPLDYDYYDYTDQGEVRPIRPPQEASFGSQQSKNDLSGLRPQDSIVTKPVFSPDGTLLFEAEKSGTEEKLDRLIDSLGSLIHLINATKEQGNSLSSSKPVSIDQSSLVNVPPGFGAGQMGNFALPGNNETEGTYQEESLFENSVSHHLGSAPLQGSAFFNIKRPLGTIDQNDNRPKTTIPPHLIPLGSDGTPLINPDGTLILKEGQPLLNYGDNKKKLTDIFPFLGADQQHLHQLQYIPPSGNGTDVDNRDFLTRALNMARELPMDTRRRMLAGLTMGVPMAALTMATMGVPTLAIAPMALAIPGFLFAAFTETQPNASTRQGDDGHGAHGLHGLLRHGGHGGHGHGDHGAAQRTNEHGHGHGAHTTTGHSRRRGIAGLIDAVRDFRRNHNTQSRNSTQTRTTADTTGETDDHANGVHHHFFG